MERVIDPQWRACRICGRKHILAGHPGHPGHPGQEAAQEQRCLLRSTKGGIDWSQHGWGNAFRRQR